MTYRTKRFLFCWMLCLSIPASVLAQSRREDIYTDFVMYQKRVLLEKDLHDRIIGRNFSIPLDSNSEYNYESACNAVSQFLFASPEVEQGFANLFAGYDFLSYFTRRAFLEALYAVGRQKYVAPVRAILENETDPRLFSLSAVYLYRSDTSTANSSSLQIRMAEKFPGYDTIPVLHELENYLSYHGAYREGSTPDIAELLGWWGSGAGARAAAGGAGSVAGGAARPVAGLKIIYSFQRWDRDYPGLALVQNANGSLVRDAQGRIQLFRQLARSGPDLPYFMTNGSTPQGIYSIQGMGVSHTNFIGPTPNIQLILPNEGKWERFFHVPRGGDPAAMGITDDSTADPLLRYQALLPPGWRDYAPMMEAWTAGRIGRTEIIAHGTTIDPEYFSGRPFYPLTPTMGCLCAKELWNPTSGHLLVSEQFNLVSAFQSTPGDKGYLVVINVDDKRKPVSREEVEAWVKKVEAGRK
jgi:hypothetical protein